MKPEEKIALIKKIKSLPVEYLRGIWEIFTDQSLYNVTDFEEFTIEIN